MQRSVKLSCEYLNAEELQEELDAYNLVGPGAFDLQLRKTPSRWRGVDQNILLALVSLASASLGALITGLLKIAEKKQDAYIELHGSNWSVKVLTGTPYSEIEKYVELAKSKTIEEIKIIKGDIHN
jgi:hypothetical protein